MRNRSESFANDVLAQRADAARQACVWRDIRDDLRPARGIANGIWASLTMVLILVGVVML